MPVYEYQASTPEAGCRHCRRGFETIQKLNDSPLSACIYCGNAVRKVVSWCRSAVIERSPEHVQVKDQIKSYEKAGMWSHAAELADRHAKKIDDKHLKTRALENYKKAGYDFTPESI